jgi:hypothetical protein
LRPTFVNVEIDVFENNLNCVKDKPNEVDVPEYMDEVEAIVL